jgi:hypothetical protein
MEKAGAKPSISLEQLAISTGRRSALIIFGLVVSFLRHTNNEGAVVVTNDVLGLVGRCHEYLPGRHALLCALPRSGAALPGRIPAIGIVQTRCGYEVRVTSNRTPQDESTHDSDGLTEQTWGPRRTCHNPRAAWLGGIILAVSIMGGREPG